MPEVLWMGTWALSCIDIATKYGGHQIEEMLISRSSSGCNDTLWWAGHPNTFRMCSHRKKLTFHNCSNLQNKGKHIHISGPRDFGQTSVKILVMCFQVHPLGTCCFFTNFLHQFKEYSIGSCKTIGDLPKVLNLNRPFFKLNQPICNYWSDLPACSPGL